MSISEIAREYGITNEQLKNHLSEKGLTPKSENLIKTP